MHILPHQLVASKLKLLNLKCTSKFYNQKKNIMLCVDLFTHGVLWSGFELLALWNTNVVSSIT